MKELTKEEMKQIEGGVNWALVTLVSGALSFVIGIVDGIFNPKKCNN